MKNNNYPLYDLPMLASDMALQVANEFSITSSALSQAIQQLIDIPSVCTEVMEVFATSLGNITSQYEWFGRNEALIEAINSIAIDTSALAEVSIQIPEDISWIHRITNVLPDYNLLHIYSDDISDEESEEIEEVNDIIIGEIFKPESEGITSKNDSAIIALSPINDDILKYLAEHPEAMYHLSGNEFEDVMAELYNKLGYDVHKTKRTRDGGKDIIIRKPDLLGDFILYVECKKYAANRPIGVSIVRNLESTISMDRVNGGILATTSFFTKDARELIRSKNLQYQIRMQDYNDIRNLLNKVV